MEYKRESFGLFQSMMDRIEDQAVQYMFKLELSRVVPDRRRAAPVRESKAEASALQGERQEAKHSPGSGSPTTVRRQEPKVGRNDPCPCGSGKKYKKCHGASEGAAAS